MFITADIPSLGLLLGLRDHSDFGRLSCRPFFKTKKATHGSSFCSCGISSHGDATGQPPRLYFGTTWLVNCIALSGILSVLLVSNLFVERRRPASLGIYYACLCATLLADYLIP